MLDYTQHEKKVLPVKLINGETVLLTAPKKALFKKLTEIKERLSETTDPMDAYDEILQITADVLSSNKTGAKFTIADIDELMDVEDMALLISEYSKYAGKLIKNPN